MVIGMDDEKDADSLLFDIASNYSSPSNRETQNPKFDLYFYARNSREIS
jgi:hypothetical protein